MGRIHVVIRRLRFSFHFSKSRFAEALAASRSYPVLRSAEEFWAAYRLGIYKTVVDSQSWGDGDWRTGFALVVSLAACGRAEEARGRAISLLASRRATDSQCAALATALAPYIPELALEVIEGRAAQRALKGALLLRMGRQEEGSAILSSDDVGKSDPRDYLLLNNAAFGSPPQQLSRMNAFLGAYGLTPVVLRDESFPPGPMNQRVIEPLPSVTGPLVSVLMTTYRAGERISYAIMSLLEQTYRNIEVIVVDDASDDETGDIVQALAARDRRVTYVKLPCNVGTYVAKSVGLRYASGEFVTCHDSDDWSHPLRIERQVAPLLKDKRLVFTTSYWVRMQDDGMYYSRSVHPLMRVNPASPLFRRDTVLNHAGTWDLVRTGADSEFYARLKLVFGRRAMHRVVEPLAFGAHRPNSLMTAPDTGYSATGLSPARLSYWEAWTRWHIEELRSARKPRLPNDLLAERPFSAPESMQVSKCNIERCLDFPAKARPAR